jgi:hypothetical protein
MIPIPLRRAALFVPFVLVAAAPVDAQTIERISVTSAGQPSNRDVDYVTRPTDDGGAVLFSTDGTNFFPNDLPFTFDAFLRERATGTTRHVAASAIGTDVSRDGGLLAYTAMPSLTQHVVDQAAGTDTAVTAPPILSTTGYFSGDGRFLVYMRDDPNVSGDFSIWRRELATGVEDLVSATQTGSLNFDVALPGFVGPDASLVTFTTFDPNIVPGDANGRPDAFYKDYNFGFSDRYSLDSQGNELPQDSSAGAFTPDTRFFLFSTFSPAIPADTNGQWDLYVTDRFLGDVKLVSVGSTGALGDASSQSLWAWISPDGERVIFDSLASTLVPGDTNGTRDVFEHDFSTGLTRRIVMGIGGAQPDQDLELRGASSDGRYLTILSRATNLVPGAQVAERQAYLVDLGPQCFVTSYCSANPNSTGVPASINSTGNPSFSTNNFVLSGLDLPASTACLFFHGTARVDPAVPFGDGLRCVGGTQQRLGTLAANGGTVIQFQDLHAAEYAGVQPGSVRRFQLIYRDPAAGGARFNTTAALEVTFCP